MRRRPMARRHQPPMHHGRDLYIGEPPRPHRRWLDEPWVHVALAFLLMGTLYVGVSWLIQLLEGAPT